MGTRKGRFLKNLKNNRVLAWTPELAARDDMIECDERGYYKGENVTGLDNPALIRALDEKIRQYNEAIKELAEARSQLKQYKSLYGELDTALPQKSVAEVIEEAVVEADPKPPKRKRRTKKAETETPPAEVEKEAKPAEDED